MKQKMHHNETVLRVATTYCDCHYVRPPEEPGPSVRSNPYQGRQPQMLMVGQNQHTKRFQEQWTEDENKM